MKTITSVLKSVVLVALGVAVGWSIQLVKADSSPATHVFELRTYTAEAGRLPALHSRFRDHTVKLFEKHGMKNIVYMTPVDENGKLSEDKLVYLLSHKSLDAAKASFAEFRKDPAWIAAKDASEKDGKITAKVESQFMVPTDFSPLK